MKKLLLTLSSAFIALSTLFLTGCEKEDPDAISMDTVNKGIEIITGADGKEYQVVDLGTGVKWAVCNIGASSPEQTGSFFSWGEVTTKDAYSMKNYKWSQDGDLFSFTKYCNDSKRGTRDNIIQLEDADDAAKVIMGKDWYIPEEYDFRQLLTKNNCTCKWCKLNGIGGYLFTSVKKGYEGNSIFIPLSGTKDNKLIRFEGQDGWYWCNTLGYEYEYNKDDEEIKDVKYSIVTQKASVLFLEHADIDNHIISSKERFYGLPIRPIYVGD